LITPYACFFSNEIVDMPYFPGYQFLMKFLCSCLIWVWGWGLIALTFFNYAILDIAFPFFFQL